MEDLTPAVRAAVAAAPLAVRIDALDAARSAGLDEPALLALLAHATSPEAFAAVNPLAAPAREAAAATVRALLFKPVASSGIKCRRCASTNTAFTEKQTRSADEPMTLFFTCNECGCRWKE